MAKRKIKKVRNQRKILQQIENKAPRQKYAQSLRNGAVIPVAGYS